MPAGYEVTRQPLIRLLRLSWYYYLSQSCSLAEILWTAERMSWAHKGLCLTQRPQDGKDHRDQRISSWRSPRPPPSRGQALAREPVWVADEGRAWEFSLARLTRPAGPDAIVRGSWRESHGGSAGDGQSQGLAWHARGNARSMRDARDATK
jgi:hypothetical protein